MQLYVKQDQAISGPAPFDVFQVFAELTFNDLDVASLI